MAATERARRIEAGDDADRVRSEVRRARRPVIFSEAASDAFRAFVASWTPERFRALVGEHTGHVRYYPEGDCGPASQARPMALREAFDAVEREHPAPNYSTRLAADDPRHLAFGAPLFDDLRGLCAALASLSWGAHVFDTVWFGGPGTVTPLHYDPVARLHGVLRGAKLFTLYPPDRQHLRWLEVCPPRSPLRNYSAIGLGPLEPGLFPGLARARPVEAALEPGDMLYIPPCWWHHVTISRPFTVTASVAWFPAELYRLWAYWRLKLGELAPAPRRPPRGAPAAGRPM